MKVPSSETQGQARGSQSGRQKRGTKVFKYGRKSPWVPTLTKLFPKIQFNSILIGHKKCFVLLCLIGEQPEQSLLCSFREFAHDDSCLDLSPKKCTQSGSSQFDIKSQFDFKILSARKLKRRCTAPEMIPTPK